MAFASRFWIGIAVAVVMIGLSSCAEDDSEALDHPMFWSKTNKVLADGRRFENLTLIIESPCNIIGTAFLNHSRTKDIYMNCKLHYNSTVDDLASLASLPMLSSQFVDLVKGQQTRTDSSSPHHVRQKRAIGFIIGFVVVLVITNFVWNVKQQYQIDELKEGMAALIESQQIDFNKIRDAHNELANQIGSKLQELEDSLARANDDMAVSITFSQFFQTARVHITNAERDIRAGKFPIDLLMLGASDKPVDIATYEQASIISSEFFINELGHGQLNMEVSYPLHVVNSAIYKVNAWPLLRQNDTHSCEYEYSGTRFVAASNDLSCIHPLPYTGEDIAESKVITLTSGICIQPNENSIAFDESHYRKVACLPKQQNDNLKFFRVELVGKQFAVYCPGMIIRFGKHPGQNKTCNPFVPMFIHADNEFVVGNFTNLGSGSINFIYNSHSDRAYNSEINNKLFGTFSKEVYITGPPSSSLSSLMVLLLDQINNPLTVFVIIVVVVVVFVLVLIGMCFLCKRIQKVREIK